MIKQVRSWSKDNRKRLIASKKVDWSIFEYGTHIPFEFHNEFALANGNRFLKKGEKKTVKLLVDNEIYHAELVNAERRDYDGDSLELRYPGNHKLKQLLKETFSVSFNYLSEERDKNPGKKITTPEDIAEFIDFFATDEPFVYNVELRTNKPRLKKISYWWVNQGRTYRQEKRGGYLWAPQKGRHGREVDHHIRLLEADVGDLVFCYAEKEIKAIGVVKKRVVEAQKPTEFTTDEWQEDGYLLELAYYEFEKTIKKDDIPLQWRLDELGPFNRNGDLNQGYFFSISDKFAHKVYQMFSNQFPIEVRTMIENNAPENASIVLSNKELVDHIHAYISAKGFFYSKEDVANLYLSLKTKPFVILSGISGTGKTQIVRNFAESLGATVDNGRLMMIPVRPDWNDGSDLLGYTDLKGKFNPGPLTILLQEASKEENRNKPYFVLLDEMNLARVEYYFSDLLSIMESREWKGDRIVTDSIRLDNESGKSVSIPDNVYIIGTVNMDETTHPFSQKVLDRANVIEFNHVKLDDFSFFDEKTVPLESIEVSNDLLRGQYVRLKEVYSEEKEYIHKITKKLVEINVILKEINASFGYRIRDEICFYMIHNKHAQLLDENDAFDFQIHQKILPRLTGNNETSYRVLKELYRFCTNRIVEDDQLDTLKENLDHAIYPKSASKLADMIRRQYEDGFTSFWF